MDNKTTRNRGTFFDILFLETLRVILLGYLTEVSGKAWQVEIQSDMLDFHFMCRRDPDIGVISSNFDVQIGKLVDEDIVARMRREAIIIAAHGEKHEQHRSENPH